MPGLRLLQGRRGHQGRGITATNEGPRWYKAIGGVFLDKSFPFFSKATKEAADIYAKKQ
jgi:hypothetical protein